MSPADLTNLFVETVSAPAIRIQATQTHGDTKHFVYYLTGFPFTGIEHPGQNTHYRQHTSPKDISLDILRQGLVDSAATLFAAAHMLNIFRYLGFDGWQVYRLEPQGRLIKRFKIFTATWATRWNKRNELGDLFRWQQLTQMSLVPSLGSLLFCDCFSFFQRWVWSQARNQRMVVSISSSSSSPRAFRVLGFASSTQRLPFPIARYRDLWHLCPNTFYRTKPNESFHI